MRTETIEYKIYTYDELSEKAKQKALETLWDINVDSDFWYDYAGKTGFNQAEIDAMHAFGLPADYKIPVELIDHDKLYFSIDREWYVQLVNAQFADDEITRCFCEVSRRVWCMLDVTLYTTRGRNGNTRVNVEYRGRRDDLKRVNDAIARIEERINDKIQQVLIDLEKNYEYLTGREAIEETIRANEYEFTEEGKIW